ncbi:helix-turn-helix domain-containing protein [Listeria booriae]|uniref:helix-turn-helix domain-containing protein n=1 Tax=Listeria booriae TaxID=1552123 RepID=UPI0016287BEA|nr:helix-turn-helix transcriptional regulator [Listeria booriae]MBC2103989.1 helix-turn-helix transcriptional regulator [Listeria booriae]
MDLYSKIQDICEHHGISIRALERDLGFAKNSIYKWQKQSPSVDKVIQVADKLNLPLDYLIGRKVELNTSKEDALYDEDIKSYQELRGMINQLGMTLVEDYNPMKTSVSVLYTQDNKNTFLLGEKLGELDFYTVVLTSADFIREINAYGVASKRRAEIEKVIEIFRCK